MTLPADVARCLGYGAAECNTCRRYTDPPHERQTWTGPWELEGVPCEMRIPYAEAAEKQGSNNRPFRPIGQGSTDRNRTVGADWA